MTITEYRGYWKSPLGWIQIKHSNRAVKRIDFVQREKVRSSLGSRHPLLAKVMRELNRYFEGQKVRWDFPIELNGSRFQKRVWKEARRIPSGCVMSYGQLARQAGSDKAARGCRLKQETPSCSVGSTIRLALPRNPSSVGPPK